MPGAMTAQKNGSAAPTAALARNPFTRAAREAVEQSFDDRTINLSASASTFVTDVRLPAAGYLRAIIMEVTCTGGIATYTYGADGPWNILRDITLSDANGRPIVGPISGYEAYLVNKWFGDAFDSDPLNDPDYLAPTSGNFSFKLRIPVQVSTRDGFGALPNMNAAEAYRLSYTVTTLAAATLTGGTGAIAMRVRCHHEYWFPPMDTDPRGVPNETTPPAVNSVQTVTKSNPAIAVGENRVRLSRTGGFIRGIILVNRDAAARSNTPVPATLRAERDSQLLFNASDGILRKYMRERSGYQVDTGVRVIDFCHDLDGKIGFEMRDQWLPTTTATRLELVGTWAGTTPTLDVITVDVSPAGSIWT